MSLLATLCVLGIAVALLVLELRTHFRWMRALSPRQGPAPLEAYPSITVIRPVKGLDSGAAENMRAGLDPGYPGAVQTLFVFDDEQEPAVATAREAIDEHERSGRHGSAEILFCGAPPPGQTGKLNAMIKGLEKAGGEVVVFADSDIRTDRHALRVLVETLLQSPDVGSAFAPVIVSEPNRTLGDAVCAILLNGFYNPPAAEWVRRCEGELPFILGQFMAMTREALAATGGLDKVRGQLVDDLYIGQLVQAAGLRNVCSSHPIRIIQWGRGPRDALNVAARWFAFSRTGIPDWSFKIPIAVRAASFWVGALGALAFTLSGQGLFAAAYGALAALVVASVGGLHQRVGGAPLRGLHWLAPAVAYLVAPIMFARAYRVRRVSWRGRDYELNDQGRLASP
ncbi:MAG: glycosyltransferase [Myxococcota bacterium]